MRLLKNTIHLFPPQFVRPHLDHTRIATNKYIIDSIW